MPSNFFENLIDREYFGMKLGLEKIQKVLKGLGNPEEKFRSIHVAGTNGKGSTAIMIARILEAGGYRVGLFTSPHLQRVNERFQINGQLISDSRLNALADAVETIDDPTNHLTFFEYLTAIAFLYFAQEKVDVAIIEVGLGGRLDATNVLKPEVSVITSIFHDHQKHLGQNLEKIAAEKGGIIKDGVPVVCGEARRHIRRVFRGLAQRTSIHFVNPPKIHEDQTFDSGSFKNLWIPTLGRGQAQNASVAIKAVQTFIKGNQNSPIVSRQAFYRGLASSVIPGRMEIIHRDPLIFLDGAHNPAAIDHLVSTCRQTFSGRKIHCLFGAMADKDIAAMFRKLRALGGELYVAAPRLKRAASIYDLISSARRQGLMPQEHADCRAALKQIMKGLNKDEALVVTGSLFLVGEARDYLKRPLLASS